MFYEQVVLAKKGPLGHVWLAAHWEKKLTRQQVTDTKIVETVEQIKNPRAQMALRLSGHLLLGVVRIYYRQVDYLYTDCNDALGRLKKLTFSPGTVNIDESVTNLRNVTMPETVADFEVVLPGDISTQQIHDVEEGVFTMNIANAADITLPPDELERMRGGDRRLSLDGVRQPDISIPSDYDLMNPDAPPDIAMGDVGATEFPEMPEEPGFEFPDLGQQGWDGLPGAEEEAELAMPELPRRAPAGAVRGGRRQRYVVDRSTELTNAAIEKNIIDPSPLLRKLQRAPHTQELLEIAKGDTRFGLQRLFNEPTMTGLAPELLDMMRLTMKPASEIDLPQMSIDTSDIEDRRRPASEAEVERGGSPFRVEPGGDFGMPFPEEEMPMPFPEEERSAAAKSVAGASEEEEEERVSVAPAEERKVVITKRTAAMHEFLGRRFTEAGSKATLSFNSLFEGKSRHAAAVGFFELLTIKSKKCIDVKQKEPYGDLQIKKTADFNALTA